METISVAVVEIEEKHFILIKNAGEEIKIPLSDDKPKDVKSAFNQLIMWVKKGKFEIEMKEVGTDLFSLVAQEYIIQLNREIQEVRGEMEDLGLVESGN
ncbi:MAG: hypothetical protein KGI54_13315 [Pseudomonadota bacterium]|nr:hypothetical protein [Pseudomonadota bacterium]